MHGLWTKRRQTCLVIARSLRAELDFYRGYPYLASLRPFNELDCSRETRLNHRRLLPRKVRATVTGLKRISAEHDSFTRRGSVPLHKAMHAVPDEPEKKDTHRANMTVGLQPATVLVTSWIESSRRNFSIMPYSWVVVLTSITKSSSDIPSTPELKWPESMLTPSLASRLLT